MSDVIITEPMPNPQTAESSAVVIPPEQPQLHQTVLAIVGRPNVGKSTLFNRLTRSKDALVADYPGLTRDRQYGLAKIGESTCIVVDTGGLSGEEDGIDPLMASQVQVALAEAQAIVFVVDGEAGMTPADERIAQYIRRFDKPVFLLVNKTDLGDVHTQTAEFMGLGFTQVFGISASQGHRVQLAFESILPQVEPAELESPLILARAQQGIRVAIVGRPNVGKSTLVNRIVGEERVVAFDMPGTTRDSIYVPFERQGRQYTLIDTAGIRRRKNIKEAIEKFSIVKAMQAMEAAHVVVLVVDATEGITDQDLTLLGLAVNSGRGLILGFNKWDNLSDEQRTEMHRDMDTRLNFVDYAIKHKLSALHGTGVGTLYKSINRIHAAATKDLKTTDLTKVLESAVDAHQPPLVGGRRIKLRYAHAGGKTPPRIIIHGNQLDKVPRAYCRYLENVYRKAFGLIGTPIVIEFKIGDNPYKDKKREVNVRAVRRHQRYVNEMKKQKKRKQQKRRGQ